MKRFTQKYRNRVKALGYSDDQADEVILRLSAILCAFIDAAWSRHPVQLSGGKLNNKGLPCLPDYARIGTHSTRANQPTSEDRTTEE